MKKIVISAEELEKIGLAVKTVKGKVEGVEFNVIGKKLGGVLIVSRGKNCIELPSEIKFKEKPPEKS